MQPELIYSTPFFFASTSILIVALFTFVRRNTSGAWYLILLCLAGALWAASEGMLYLGMDIKTNILITEIQYVGIVTVIPLTLIFTLSTFGFQRWINLTMVVLLLTIAAMIILMVWTNPLHQMVFSKYVLIDSGPVPMLGVEHGPLWWGIIGYHYALTALMSTILLQTLITARGIRRSQAGVVLVAVCVVWLANAIYVLGKSPIPNMDLGPLAFIFVTLSLSWGFFKYNLLDVLPIAKAHIFMALNDPILVIDEKKRILGINPAAERLFDLKASESIGEELGRIVDDRPQLRGVLKRKVTEEVGFQVEDRQRFFDARISPLKDKSGSQIGQILFFQDVTERKLANETSCENERLQGVLEMAGAVCHDLSQPVRVLIDHTDMIHKTISADHPLYPKTVKLSEQAQRLKEITIRLTGITRYETREYLHNKIVDIEKSSARIKAP